MSRSANSHRTRLFALSSAAVALFAGSCSNSTRSPAAAGRGGSHSAYDTVINAAPVASAATVAANSWAAAIKKQGYLRVGGIDQDPLFSIKNLQTGEVQGFDAGLSQMLARYITGKSDVPSLTKLTIATVDTRETVLQNHAVDAVFDTYTITPQRANKVDFAGPYYESGAGIMVRKDNTSITQVGDLNGKNVVAEADTSAALAVQKFAPKAKVTLFRQDAECVSAVQQGRADAYVIDESIIISDASANPAVKVVGKPFTKEPYGVGVPKDQPAAKQFVNDWLRTIYADGSWAKLWQETIGTIVPGAPPATPAIGSVAGS